MLTPRPRTVYSEHEAARTLGVSVEQLRSLVKNHIVKDEDVPADAVRTFQESDLLILKILSGAVAGSTAA
jgi:DNA-binding transcriptional MerR regulator